MGKENRTITEMVRAVYGLTAQDIRTYSPLTLAYIGDAIYDLVIRTMLVEKGNSQVNKLHHRASSFVKAGAQKRILEIIEPLLTPEEHGYYKRGRNAKSFTTAKNASVVEYRMATGFEALLGFLYLTGQTDRLLELVKAGTDALSAESGQEGCAGNARPGKNETGFRKNGSEDAGVECREAEQEDAGVGCQEAGRQEDAGAECQSGG